MQWPSLWEQCQWWWPPPASADCCLEGSCFSWMPGIIQDWLWVAEMEGLRDVFAKRAAAMIINYEASGFSEEPEV